MSHRLLLGLEFDGEYDPRVRAELEQLVARLQVWQANIPANDAQYLVATASDDLSAERVGINSPTIRVDYGTTGFVKWHADPAAFGAGYMMGSVGGEDGAEGPPGRDGTIGVNGATGATGPAGPSFMALDGEDGDQWGLPGPQGPMGVTGGTDLVKLSQIVTTGSQSTVDFTSISGAYSALRVAWQGQDTTAGTGQSNLRLKINNDGTSGNYTTTGRSGANNGTNFSSADAAAATGGTVGNLPNTGTTSQAGTGDCLIVNYADTTFFKMIQTTWSIFTTTSNNTVGVSGFSWKSTAAITRLTFTAATAFTDGSRFTLYGLT